MTIITRIIDRDCHVSLNYRQVVRHVAFRLKGGWATFKSLPREQRKAFILECCARHYENIDLYVEVTTGNLYRGRNRHGEPAKGLLQLGGRC